MSTTSKIVIGLGVVSGALLATWLLTGSRKTKTKTFLVRNARKLNHQLRGSVRKPTHEEESEMHYV